MKTKWASGLVALVAVVTVGATACKPTVKGESQKFDRNLKSAMELKSEYPSFATHLGAMVDAAKTAMKTAEKEGNEEKKAAAMKEANGAFDNKLFRQLSSVKSRSESIDDGVKKLSGKKVPSGKVGSINAAMRNARKKQSEALAMLRKGDCCATMEDAQKTADDAVGLLIDANNLIDRAQKDAAGDKKKK